MTITLLVTTALRALTHHEANGSRHWLIHPTTAYQFPPAISGRNLGWQDVCWPRPHPSDHAGVHIIGQFRGKAGPCAASEASSAIACPCHQAPTVSFYLAGSQMGPKLSGVLLFFPFLLFFFQCRWYILYMNLVLAVKSCFFLRGIADKMEETTVSMRQCHSSYEQIDMDPERVWQLLMEMLLQ